MCFIGLLNIKIVDLHLSTAATDIKMKLIVLILVLAKKQVHLNVSLCPYKSWPSLSSHSVWLDAVEDFSRYPYLPAVRILQLNLCLLGNKVLS